MHVLAVEVVGIIVEVGGVIGVEAGKVEEVIIVDGVDGLDDVESGGLVEVDVMGLEVVELVGI